MKMAASTAGSVCCLLHVGFLLGLLFHSEDEGYIFLKKFVIFTGLLGVISQTLEIF
jgi:hypothetical protein